MASGTIVEVLEGAQALRALVPEWEALAEEAVEPNPFYEHWMLLPALEAYEQSGEFRCIVVRDDGHLGALFPMRLERRYRGLPLGALRSWRHRNMLLCTPLVHPRSAAKCVTALLRSALAPLLQFDYVAAGGWFCGVLAEAAAAEELPWVVTDAYMRALLLRGHDPRARLNAKARNNLKRRDAAARALGEVTPVRLAPGQDLDAALDAFLRLEASGWKGRAGSALACREDDRRFVAAVLPEAFRRGRLQITGLDLAGRPLARQILFTAGEGGVVFKIAYDEAHEKCSPGVLGEAEMVRQFLDHPGPAWMDSNTAPENAAYAGVWKDRRTVQAVAVGLQGAGKLAVASLPLLRLAKRWRWRWRGGGSARRIIPAMSRTDSGPAGLAATPSAKPRGL